MCQFIESIKIHQRQAFLSDLHQQRVEQTFACFRKACSLDLKSVFKSLKIKDDRLYKWRVVYDLAGNFSTEIIPYSFVEIRNFELIENNLVNYSFKFLDRTALNQMKENSTAQEIIIVKNGKITDTSSSNLVFLKDKIWHTPKTFLLNGVQRQRLLLSGEIHEVEISLKNLREFSHFQLINAMNDLDHENIYPIERIINLSSF